MLPFLGSEVPNRESSCAARLFVEVVHQQSTGRVDRLAFESPSFQTLNPAADGRHAQVDDRFVVPDGRHGTGAFWATRFGGDRGAGSGNPALDENMVMGYVLWKTIYRAYKPFAEPEDDDAGI